MRLEEFRVNDFRSVNDSGPIKVTKTTALLGRNESGKTNLLLALSNLKPSSGFVALDKVKDFPRHRRLEECNDKTVVVTSRWRLEKSEQDQLAKIWPRSVGITHVEIGRWYGAQHFVSFPGAKAQEFDEAEIKKKIRKIVPAVKAAASSLAPAEKTKLETAADTFEAATVPLADIIDWANKTVAASGALRKALAAANKELTDAQDQHLVELEDSAKAIAGDRDAQATARTWAVEQMPIFIYLDEYPELSGHQNISDLISRRQQKNQTDADRNFEKMCKVAGLNPDELQTLFTNRQQETRNQLANRASAVVTTEIRRLWKDRALKIRFNPDAEYLDTFVSDPNSVFDVEVNLDERSRGFKWFFSFYITFAADTKGGNAEKAILLLDEPGLYLHARSQTDLLAHFEKDFANQILYTTHSPFMVPTHHLDSVRTVNITEQGGTTVSNDPVGDARTLFPLQAALGYDLAQSLFVGPNNLIVEGVTDYWILSSVSAYLSDAGKKGLEPAITITPAGGAQKVSYMVALLSSEELNVLVLLDSEDGARATRDELVKTKLIRERNVIFVAEAFGSAAPKEADTEDLLDPTIYEKLVRESYAKELSSATLSLNPNVPRIAKRFELAMAAIGIQFHKTRPARLFLQKMAKDPSQVLGSAVARFEALFELANERLSKQSGRSAKPFT